ncbi:hypothetical protein MLD38_028482 [Melastoma candidum]|uniref:Uncharacterized protein n=1 Tax=Melastoma candidum TaxID=119954 RepID=A0ACB9N152_9MYRT|nr:hypothetical protein MLD38_028482 [Melastoma candidum]
METGRGSCWLLDWRCPEEGREAAADPGKLSLATDFEIAGDRSLPGRLIRSQRRADTGLICCGWLIWPEGAGSSPVEGAGNRGAVGGWESWDDWGEERSLGEGGGGWSAWVEGGRHRRSLGLGDQEVGLPSLDLGVEAVKRHREAIAGLGTPRGGGWPGSWLFCGCWGVWRSWGAGGRRRQIATVSWEFEGTPGRRIVTSAGAEDDGEGLAAGRRPYGRHFWVGRQGRGLHRVDFWLTLAKEKWKMVVTIEEDGTPSASRQKKRQLKMRLRLCEICGKTAENVSGIRDNRFMEEWNGKVPACASTSLSEGNDCWNRPPLCNMLTSCQL